MKYNEFNDVINARHAREGVVFQIPPGADEGTAFSFIPADELWEEQIKKDLQVLRQAIGAGKPAIGALSSLHKHIYELEIALTARLETNSPAFVWTFRTANGLVDRRRELDVIVLNEKNKDYGSEDNKLANFYEAAEFSFGPAMALYGFMVKHVTTVKAMVDGRKPVTQENIDEKLGDFHRYLVLLEALWIEMFANS